MCWDLHRAEVPAHVGKLATLKANISLFKVPCCAAAICHDSFQRRVAIVCFQALCLAQWRTELSGNWFNWAKAWPSTCQKFMWTSEKRCILMCYCNLCLYVCFVCKKPDDCAAACLGQDAFKKRDYSSQWGFLSCLNKSNNDDNMSSPPNKAWKQNRIVINESYVFRNESYPPQLRPKRFSKNSLLGENKVCFCCLKKISGSVFVAHTERREGLWCLRPVAHTREWDYRGAFHFSVVYCSALQRGLFR